MTIEFIDVPDEVELIDPAGEIGRVEAVEAAVEGLAGEEVGRGADRPRSVTGVESVTCRAPLSAEEAAAAEKDGFIGRRLGTEVLPSPAGGEGKGEGEEEVEMVLPSSP